ncbi:5'-methylthioadenosine/S-adenosylhomocysteine nucleosidase [Streptococcus sp. HMSC071D03]|uniref:5'-methylthioadenosine/adenosylhomocysteine nucleosidase n=1 Tax=Streptococcus sp. HMSC071D03 TaxID=1739341 RepID=UPI0008CEB839|nr:5'-methylthioadenosine/adenosylhomocysteine nucleosidase [Streptococcus sp. HMSC071D03]OFK03618.1 5'-methylthioadenosine/S-adenosylhomocysteine nucleosidase [Streptococcus sp. HMSC071D03]
MKIGIIAAMPEELAYLLQHLDDAREEKVLGNSYHTGKVGSVELVLVESGIGKVMSAMSVAILADHFQVDAVINTGSAGAVANGIAVGDVVIADKLCYHDVDVTAFGYDYGQMARQPLYFESDKKFISLIQESLSKLEQTWHLGLIATGDSFVAGEDKIKAIKEQFPQVLAVEMEGAAIAQAAHALNLPFLVVRAMSDNANHEASVSFDEFIVEAGRRSAQALMTLLQSIKD